jgi:hypothetical protein
MREFYGGRGRRLDRAIVAAVVLVLAAGAFDTLLGKHGARRPAEPALPAAAVPERVALRGSPETAFLRTCPDSRLRLSLVAGPRVRLLYAGGRCHLPSLRLVAIVRRGRAVVYRGPAVEEGALAGNLAGRAELLAPLLPGLLRCESREPLTVEVRARSLSASGEVTCRRPL